MRTKPLAKKKAARADRKGGSAGKKTKTAARKPARPAPSKARKEKAPAAPVQATRAPAPDQPNESKQRALTMAQAGLDKKAEDVVLLDVRGLTSYADYFVLMTADSERQASAIADHVDETLKSAGEQKVGVEGYGGGRWVLIDYGDVVAHVFSREARGFYDLEGLWADAVRIPVEG